MRQTRKSQLALGEARIEDIKLDHKSRDDIPAVLLGLQHLYTHKQTREKLFSLTVREFLGHGAFSQGDTYELQTIINNVYLLPPELLSEIGRLVVESGHAVARKKLGEPLRGRCDSFVVEADVHYPTDVNLLWDAMRCLLRELGHAAKKYEIVGWRQWRHLTKEVRNTPAGSRRGRRAVRWSSEFPCAWLKTNSSSSFTTR